MLLEKIIIENFRALKELELDLRQDLSLIVGKNNCGKTSILTIMDKFLNSNNVSFEWDDFNLLFQEEFRNKILSYNKVEENKCFDSGGIKMTMYIKYNKEDSYTNIQKFMMDLNPENNYIVLEFYYNCKESKLKELQETILASEIGDNINKFSKFMKKNLRSYFCLERYARHYDVESKDLTDEKSSELEKRDIDKVIKFKSIKASRDVSNKTNDHSLSTLSANYYKFKKSINGLDLSNLQEQIEDTDGKLSEIYNTEIFTDVIKSIKKFGGKQNETDITIESTLQEHDLFRDNTTLFYTQKDKRLPESYNGLGYLNLIGMIFEIETILAELLGYGDTTPADINLLFIEEPEAHTHPQLQYIFIKNIKTLIEDSKKKGEEEILNIQTIISTHSSHIVSECDFDDIRYLTNEINGIKSKNFESLKEKYKNDVQSLQFVKQYLNLTRSELFFADKAIFIEGDTERILLPAMMKKYDNECKDKEFPLSSQNISIIEAGAFAHKFKNLLDYLNLKVLIITDIDSAKKKTNEKGKKITEGCNPKEATTTTNESIKFFFKNKLKDIEEDKVFLTIASLTKDEKIINNNIRVAFQIEEVGYQASSFEDAFISLNFEFIKNHKEKFSQGLKNKDEFDSYDIDFFDVTQKCIKKKTAFATEVLYFGGDIVGSEWDTPSYIKEGFEWLKKQ